MTGRNCTICSSPHGAAIDAALVGGARLVPTAAQFGVSKSAMGRHKTNCLAPRLAAAAQTVAGSAPVRQARAVLAGAGATSLADIGTAHGLTAKLVETMERLEHAAEQACDRAQFSSLAAVSAQILRAIESAAKLHGLYAEGPSGSGGGPAFQLNININAQGEAKRTPAVDAPLIEAKATQSAVQPLQAGPLQLPAMRLDFGEPFSLGPMPGYAASLVSDQSLRGH